MICTSQLPYQLFSSEMDYTPVMMAHTICTQIVDICVIFYTWALGACIIDPVRYIYDIGAKKDAGTQNADVWIVRFVVFGHYSCERRDIRLFLDLHCVLFIYYLSYIFIYKRYDFNHFTNI